MADNCGLETIFSLLEEQDDGLWPKFSHIQDIADTTSEVDDHVEEILDVIPIIICRDQHFGILTI